MQDLSPTEIEAIVKTLGSTSIEPQFTESHPRENSPGNPSPNVAHLQFSQLEQEAAPASLPSSEGVHNVQIEINAVLGKTHLSIRKLLELKPGMVIPLSKLAGEPVELEANGKVIALGEVVVVNENFGVRITQFIEQ